MTTTQAEERELLERAARAAGLPVEFDREGGIGWFACGRDEDGDVATWWNPLKDDGDALRLARGLNMAIDFLFDAVRCRVPGGEWIGEVCLPCDTEYLGKAQRRAIVRCAAASLGEQREGGK